MKRKDFLEKLLQENTLGFERSVLTSIYSADLINLPLASIVHMPLVNSDKTKILWRSWIYSPQETTFDKFRIRIETLNTFNLDFKVNYYMLADNIEKMEVTESDFNCTIEEVTVDYTDCLKSMVELKETMKKKFTEYENNLENE